MCLNTRFIGIMNDLSDNLCYVDDICDVQGAVSISHLRENSTYESSYEVRRP